MIFIISWREGFSRCVLHALVGHVFNHVQFKKGPKKHKLRVVWGVRGLVRACLSILQISHFVPHKKGGGGLCPRGGGIKRHVLLSGLFLQRIKTHTLVSHICSWISLFCCCKFYFFSIFESVHLVLTCLCVFYMFVCLCLSILCMLPSICTAIIV